MTRDLVLAVHPTSRGLGWALFEGPLAPVNWGVATGKPDRNAHSMAKFARLVRQYQPRTLVMEAFDEGDSARASRVLVLAKTLRGYATSHDIVLSLYNRAQVNHALGQDAGASRHVVAEAVAVVLPILRDRLPPKRKRWLPEDGRQCLFDAAALGIAHFAITQPD